MPPWPFLFFVFVFASIVPVLPGPWELQEKGGAGGTPGSRGASSCARCTVRWRLSTSEEHVGIPFWLSNLNHLRGALGLSPPQRSTLAFKHIGGTLWLFTTSVEHFGFQALRIGTLWLLSTPEEHFGFQPLRRSTLAFNHFGGALCLSTTSEEHFGFQPLRRASHVEFHLPDHLPCEVRVELLHLLTDY